MYCNFATKLGAGKKVDIEKGGVSMGWVYYRPREFLPNFHWEAYWTVRVCGYMISKDYIDAQIVTAQDCRSSKVHLNVYKLHQPSRIFFFFFYQNLFFFFYTRSLHSLYRLFNIPGAAGAFHKEFCHSIIWWWLFIYIFFWRNFMQKNKKKNATYQEKEEFFF